MFGCLKAAFALRWPQVTPRPAIFPALFFRPQWKIRGVVVGGRRFFLVWWFFGCRRLLGGYAWVVQRLFRRRFLGVTVTSFVTLSTMNFRVLKVVVFSLWAGCRRGGRARVYTFRKHPTNSPTGAVLPLLNAGPTFLANIVEPTVPPLGSRSRQINPSWGSTPGCPLVHQATPPCVRMRRVSSEIFLFGGSSTFRIIP